MNRRKFMSLITTAIGGMISLGMGIPAIAYLIGPSLKKVEENWIGLGSVNKVEIGSPTLFKVKIERKSGWIATNDEISAFVLSEDGNRFIVMSNICTHLGCRVRWIRDEEKFFCPCHVGIFDKAGNVISGPAPRPLDRYKVQVVNEEIQILAQG